MKKQLAQLIDRLRGRPRLEQLAILDAKIQRVKGKRKRKHLIALRNTVAAAHRIAQEMPPAPRTVKTLGILSPLRGV
jgi:hypothetical protein